MASDASPTARALLALEAIQASPGITAADLGERLGVTERAARRYVAILREADLPIDSVSGPYGGYRVGRGLRLPPLMFTAAEAMGLVMAVLEGHRQAANPADLVGGALAKIVRVLPERVAGPARAIRDVSTGGQAAESSPDPDITGELIGACSAARRVRIEYRLGRARDRVMDVDPWAVILRHSRWYLLGWSHTAQARRVLRLDRIVEVHTLAETFAPPRDLDALRTLEEHLSQGWTHPVDVLVDAPIEETGRWVSRSLGRLEAVSDGRTRLVATTNEPDWYARQLAAIPARFRVLECRDIQLAVRALGERLTTAASDPARPAFPGGPPGQSTSQQPDVRL
jgi:predicted DNA-binding transcriptional regulator YafY